MPTSILILALSFVSITFQAIDYIDQQSWGGICINGTRQSPRDIPSI